MTLFESLLLAAGAGAIVAYVFWWIRPREEPVPGLGWVAALRGSALLLAWLILLNPKLPVARDDLGDGEEVALLDASYSMSRPLVEGGPTLWRLAVDSAARFDAVWLFGEAVPRYLRRDSLPAEPLFRESRIVPALRAAAEAGARRLTVITDGAISDGTEAPEEAQRRGLTLSHVSLTPGYPRIGLAQLSAPAWAQAGDTVEVRGEVVAAEAGWDNVRVEILDDDGRVVAAERVGVAGAGRYTPVRLNLPTPSASGDYRYRARIAPPTPDPETRDDTRPFYLKLTERPAGPILVSLRPDWEPSFLIPNLDRLTDVPTQAYLWLTDSLLSLPRFDRVDPATVRRRARDAPLLVIHGFGADAPRWARELVQEARRLLVLPAGPRTFTLPGWDLRVSAPASGEWYATGGSSGSPLAVELGGLPLEGLPPLVRVRSIDVEAEWVPLVVRRLRRGEPRPIVMVGRSRERRWAVAAGEGYWRWAFRPGPGRQLYRRMWTGVASWLIEEGGASDSGLEPIQRVVAWGEPLRWPVRVQADSLGVTLLDEVGDTLWTGSAGPNDSLAVRLPPGRYRYLARAYQEDRIAGAADGPVEVETYSPELLPRAGVTLPEELTADRERQATRRDGGRGLATLGWPYLLLIAVFCAEWALRRFIGLR